MLLRGSRYLIPICRRLRSRLSLQWTYSTPNQDSRSFPIDHVFLHFYTKTEGKLPPPHVWYLHPLCSPPPPYDCLLSIRGQLVNPRITEGISERLLQSGEHFWHHRKSLNFPGYERLFREGLMMMSLRTVMAYLLDRFLTLTRFEDAHSSFVSFDSVETFVYSISKARDFSMLY